MNYSQNTHDLTFSALLDNVFHCGEVVENRTGISTRSIIGAQCKYDLSLGLPILTTKHVAWKMALAEMLWFISGKCDTLETLAPFAQKLWSPWADKDGNLGPIYGFQWRFWNRDAHWHDQTIPMIDQLENVIKEIKSGSTSRRLIVSAWQPAEIDNMALPPCHVLFQFTVRSGKLHLQLYQRSCDLPIGGPFNVAQYSILLCMVAKLANLTPGTFIHSIHDAHIYENQVSAVTEWIKRESAANSPTLIIHGEQKTIDDFKLSDFELVNYKHSGKISIPVAV